MLGPQQQQEYKQQGLIIPDYTIASAQLTELQRAVDAFLAECPSEQQDFIPDLMACGLGKSLGMQKDIVDMVSTLLGDDVILWASGMFAKPARVGKATPFHQDAQFWPIKPCLACTVWVAIDNSSRQNGCVEYLPGSHQQETLFEHQNNHYRDATLNQTIDIDTSQANAAELLPGQLSIHHPFLLHGSRANTSGQRRAGVTLRYMSASAFYDREYAKHLATARSVPDISMRTLYLVKGVSRNPLNQVVAPE